MLPVNEESEYTEYEGFTMIDEFKGTIENTVVDYIIRDHSLEKFNIKKNIFEEAAKFIQKKYQKQKLKLVLKIATIII